MSVRIIATSSNRFIPQYEVHPGIWMEFYRNYRPMVSHPVTINGTQLSINGQLASVHNLQGPEEMEVFYNLPDAIKFLENYRSVYEPDANNKVVWPITRETTHVVADS